MLVSMHQSSVSDPEQDWINKYRAAMASSEHGKTPILRKIVCRLSYLMGITIGKSRKLVKKAAGFAVVSEAERPKPQPDGEIGSEARKTKRSSHKQNRGKTAA